MTAIAPVLPLWDLTAFFPGLESPEFIAACHTLAEDVEGLSAYFDMHQIKRQASVPLEAKEIFEGVVGRLNLLLPRFQLIASYIQGFITTDSRDSLAQARMSETQQVAMRLSKLTTRFYAWQGSLDIEALLEQSEVARDHEFFLRTSHLQATHLMSPEEEALATELNLTGGNAWTRLYGTVTSQIAVQMAGEDFERPMSAVRQLARDAERDTRRRAYEAELLAWERHAVPLAAALNGIKGEVNTISARRGWPTPLDEALFDSRIDRTTLDVMLGAAREAFPDFRRYLRVKAQALGVPALAWYDLFAPVGTSSTLWSYDTAEQFLVEQFGRYSPKLQSLVRRAFVEHWIDAAPRSGKRDGAFCMAVRGEESRILANYSPNFEAVSTLAHELGHAYHNLNLAGRTQLQRSTPMTLAETASTFCETIIYHARLSQAEPSERRALLESALQGRCQIVLDITSRFLFEERLFDARRRRELSVSELNELMLRAQLDTYGDGLDPEQLHPYMWAAKGHYYSTGRSFYNYPYMFGLLFGLGLYARFREDPEHFQAHYDSLLSATGLADAQTLASRFGIDLHAPDFWRSSLAVITQDIDQFESLATHG